MGLLGLVIVVFGIALVVAPQQVWRVTQSWQYRNPEANEPSDISYTLQRVSGGVMVVLGLFVLTQG